MYLRTLVFTTLVGMIGFSAVATAKEKQQVTVSYVVGPQRPLPEGLRAVAVINSGVSTQGVQQDEREAKWSVMAADMIEAMLQAGSAMVSKPIAVAKRSETQAVLREHDMALAGMVAGDQAATAGKLLAVQGLITSRITISIDEQRGTKSTIDWMSVMGGMTRETMGSRVEPAPAPAPVTPGPVVPAPGRGPAVVQRPARTEVRRGPDGQQYTVTRRPAPTIVYRRPPAVVYAPQPIASAHQERTVAGGGLTLQTKQVEEISRHLTVQCSFTLIDAATGAAIMQYSTPPVQKHDRKSPDFLFGSMMGEKDLDPVDHFIGELVEQSTREFVSMLVPVQVSARYELVARHSASEEALRALRADDYAGAMQGFDREIRKYPDDGATIFAMGVVSELMGKPQQGLQYYRRALASKEVDKDDMPVYIAAKDRLTQHLGRIMKPLPPGAVPPGPNPAAPPAQPGAVNAPPAPPPSAPPPGVPGQPSAAPAPPVGANPAPPAEPPAPTVEQSTLERE